MARVWIARDETGWVYMYSEEPEMILQHRAKYWKGKLICELDDACFPELTVENSPQEVLISIEILTPPGSDCPF